MHSDHFKTKLFIPNSDDWVQYCVNINPAGMSDEVNIMFSFEGTGADDMTFEYYCNNNMSSLFIEEDNIGGNWLYLDNIRIGNISLIQEEEELVRKE